MSYDKSVLCGNESAAFRLRGLYRRFGYTQYKMNKFEEYDLYVRNKDFLISDHVITFTDTNGRLLALKPDVTLSIIKNGKDTPGAVQKVYYHENVYRISDRTGAFQEIMQVGLECIGAVDDYCVLEVLSLAARSLTAISDRAVLDISHLGLLSAVLDSLLVPSATRAALLAAIGEKNLHELTALCAAADVTAQKTALLRELCTLQGAPDAVMPRLVALLTGTVPAEMLASFSRLMMALVKAGLGHIVRVDFSVVGDMGYYNGIVFKGFVEGVPTGVLSGGQYDKLMQKMGRSSSAIGFAVYLDLLERLSAEPRSYDGDALVLYGAEDDPAVLAAALEQLTADGTTVLAARTLPAGLRFRRCYRLNGKEGTLDEIDA